MSNDDLQAIKTDSKSYRAFMHMLKRQKSLSLNSNRKMANKTPGKLASFYIEVFIKHTKNIHSKKMPNILEAGESFTDWREAQILLGNIVFDKRTLSYGQGPKIVKYLNDITQEHGLVATKGYVDQQISELREENFHLRERCEKVESRVDILDRAVESAINVINPPCDEEKKRLFLASVR